MRPRLPDAAGGQCRRHFRTHRIWPGRGTSVLTGYVLYMDHLPGARERPQHRQRGAVWPGTGGSREDWGFNRHQDLSVSFARRMPDAKFSYRHDTGAWLNAAVGSPPAPGSVCQPARRGRDASDDAVMAQEDLW